MKTYERYVQIGLENVLDMILENDKVSMESLYFELNRGGQATLVRAIGLEQSFTLDMIHATKWFRREILNEDSRDFVAYTSNRIEEE